jgi:hypothetical protein
MINAVLALAVTMAPLATRTFTKPCERGSPRLALTLGVLPRGVEIVVYGEDGTLIGTAAPFALRPGTAAGRYQLALPHDRFRDGAIVLRLAARQYGAPERTPTAEEVREAAVLCVPAPAQP